jgi:hypothetical protein
MRDSAVWVLAFARTTPEILVPPVPYVTVIATPQNKKPSLSTGLFIKNLGA